MDSNAPLINLLWKNYNFHHMSDDEIKECVADKLNNIEFYSLDNMKLEFGDTIRCDMHDGGDKCYILASELDKYTGSYIIELDNDEIEVCDRCYPNLDIMEVVFAIKLRMASEKLKRKNTVKSVPDPSEFPKECFSSNQNSS